MGAFDKWFGILRVEELLTINIGGGKNEEMLDWFDSGYFYAGKWASWSSDHT